MKVAAAYALADLIEPSERSETNIIPSVFDPRVAPAVAKAVRKQPAIPRGPCVISLYKKIPSEEIRRDFSFCSKTYRFLLPNQAAFSALGFLLPNRKPKPSTRVAMASTRIRKSMTTSRPLVPQVLKSANRALP